MCQDELSAPPTVPAGVVLCDRTLVEFCCGPDSVLGQPTAHNSGCNIIRLTLEDDVTTPKGHAKAMKAVEGKNCLLWASMPCTGGARGNISTRSSPEWKLNSASAFVSFG